VRQGEVSATELIEAAISQIEALNPTLNAVIFTSYEAALARAGQPAGRGAWLGFRTC
jgi:amidase